MRFKQAGMALAALAGAIATPAKALLVQPIVIRLQSAGSKAAAAITVVNDRNRISTVEIKIDRLVIPESGSVETKPDKGDDFVVFPQIAAIEPGKTQVFRLRWVGDPALATARSYMVTTGEVPVERQAQTGVQVVYAIQSLLTVGSPGLTSDVTVVASRRAVHDYPASQAGPAHSEPGLIVTFANSGADVSYISDYRMQAEIPGTAWKLDADTAHVQQYVGLGLIAPHGRRELFLPIPDLPPTGDVRFTFKRASAR